MGHVQRGHPEVALDPGDLRAHLDPELGVEVGQRLVHEERLGLADDGPPHGHPLALSARQRGRLALQVVVQAEDPAGVPDPPVDVVLGQLSRSLRPNAMLSYTVMCGYSA